MKEPPDKYRSIKLPLASILHKNEDYMNTINKIQDAVYRTNYITIKTNMLLRLWCLEKYHSNNEIPLIDDNVIRMCIKSILVKSSGPKPKQSNLIMLDEFNQLNPFSLEDGSNLSASLNYYIVFLIKNIETNITVNFFDYINRFINSYFKNIYEDKLKNKDFKRELFKDLRDVKYDIINNTRTSHQKYHSFIEEYRCKLLPKDFQKNYYYDVKCEPQKYLKYMIYMNIELERINGKMYQFFPLQTSIIPNHICIDTKAIVELLVDKDKKMYLNNIILYKEILWDRYFKIEAKIKGYIFDNSIKTDGYTISLRFINKKYVDEQLNIKQKKKDARNEVRIKDNVKTIKEEIQKSDKQIQLKTKKEEIPEFPYIEDVDKEQLKGKHIFIDPGKRTLFTMMDDNGKFFSYTNKQRINETKRVKYQNIIHKHKDKLGITEKEHQYNVFNSKSCDISTYKQYMLAKINLNYEVYKSYQDNKFRQCRWYAFINKKRTEDNMLNKIEKTYSKDSIIIIGDWSADKQMKNFISTPNICLKRKLKDKFRVYNIDEFRTSCLNYKTEEPCNNLYLPDKNNKKRKIHAILTYQMENKRYGCINRDKNGCKNMQKIFEHYMKYNERPEKYRR